MRYLILGFVLAVTHVAVAQIRIIPRDKVLEAANPKVADSPLRLHSERVDFGTIDEMSGVWQGSVKMVNMGEESLAITRVKSTCGCLQAQPSKRVLAPREATEVLLKYYPRGHAGRVAQRVFLYTDNSAEHPSAILHLQGMVTASADRSDDYPYSRGILRLRQDTLRMAKGGRAELRVACMNGGSTTLQLGVDSLLTSKGLQVRFEPAQLSPKQEGDMVVVYDSQRNSMAQQRLKIYIKGINVPPRQGVVEVLVE